MNEMTLEEFSKRAIHRPGLDVYTAEDAILLVKLCQQASLPVLGVDAFKLFGDKIQPFMEHSIDLSNENESHDKAIKFLTDRLGMDFVYEIVY